MKEAVCITKFHFPETLTFRKSYTVLAHNEEQGLLRVQGDNKRVRWFPAQFFDLTGKALCLQTYTITIEHEGMKGNDPRGDSDTVYVDFADGQCWHAEFYTYKKIEEETRHGLGLRYFPYPNPVIVVELSRASIEFVVQDLLDRLQFESFFTQDR